MGVLAIIVGTLDLFWAKVLITTLVVAGASVIGLACATPQARAVALPIGLLGIAAAGAGLALTLFHIWYEYREGWLGNLNSTFWLIAVAMALSGLLARSRLGLGWFHWVRRITWAAVAALVMFSCIEIQAQTGDEILIKGALVSGSIAVFGTISIPILEHIAKISGASKPPPSVGSDEIELTCPR